MSYTLPWDGRRIRAVNDISFQLDHGETLGIVGESGCGKSSLAISILGVLPSNARIHNGQVLLDGQNLLGVDAESLRQIRWKRISMIFQGAMNSLDPVYKVGDLLFQVLNAHISLSEKEAWERIKRLFSLVGLPSSSIHSYPHELSGGMRQRVVIAMSLLCDPDIAIADEPVTALDVVVQDQILGEIEKLQKRMGLTLILISHDISVISETCQKIAVMYAGRIVEYGKREELFDYPSHPYTVALLGSLPNIRGDKKRLMSLAGAPPDLSEDATGCPCAPRCALAADICRKKDPPTVVMNTNHRSLCHFANTSMMTHFREEHL